MVFPAVSPLVPVGLLPANPPRAVNRGPVRQGRPAARVRPSAPPTRPASDARELANQINTLGRIIANDLTFDARDQLAAFMNAAIDLGQGSHWGERYANHFAAEPNREDRDQSDTIARTVANDLAFGQADRFAAFMNAVIGLGEGSNLGERFHNNYAAEQARTRYDAQHRRVATNVGHVGAVGLVAAESAPAAVANAWKFASREGLAWLAGGGLVGAGTQLATNPRSSPGDLAGATVGGVAGAAARHLGPGPAAAIDGAATSAVQDLFNGRPVSLQDAARSAAQGRYVGGAAGAFGRRGSNSLSPFRKGQLGEQLGRWRSALNGMAREQGPKTRDQLASGGYWVPDGRHGLIRFEDKFGYSARLSRAQRRAMAELGDNFILYHTTPDDIGRLAGLLGGGRGAPFEDDWTARWRPEPPVYFDAPPH